MATFPSCKPMGSKLNWEIKLMWKIIQAPNKYTVYLKLQVNRSWNLTVHKCYVRVNDLNLCQVSIRRHTSLSKTISKFSTRFFIAKQIKYWL